MHIDLRYILVKKILRETALGATANVIRLFCSIRNNCNYIVYFDNEYTGVHLMAYLYSKGINLLEIVRDNSLLNCKFYDDL